MLLFFLECAQSWCYGEVVAADDSVVMVAFAIHLEASKRSVLRFA